MSAPILVIDDSEPPPPPARASPELIDLTNEPDSPPRDVEDMALDILDSMTVYPGSLSDDNWESPNEGQENLETSSDAPGAAGPRSTGVQRNRPPTLTRSDSSTMTGESTRRPPRNANPPSGRSQPQLPPNGVLIDLTEDTPQAPPQNRNTPHIPRLNPRPALFPTGRNAYRFNSPGWHHAHMPLGIAQAIHSMDMGLQVETLGGSLDITRVAFDDSEDSDDHMAGDAPVVTGVFTVPRGYGPNGHFRGLVISHPSHALPRQPSPPPLVANPLHQQITREDAAPPAAPGFTRSTSDDTVAVCPGCDQELAYEPGDTPGLGKKKRSNADKAEHFFYALKACGHVYCGTCYETRRYTGHGQQVPMSVFPRGGTPKLACKVDGCKTDVNPKASWVGIYL